MKVIYTICLKCGKKTDEYLNECFACGSTRLDYEVVLTKKEFNKLNEEK